MARILEQRAVVTGGASGLGKAFCEELGARRCRVVVADIDEAGARATADAVVAAGGEAVAVKADVRSAADVERLATVADDRWGGTDLLVNNAGVAVGGPVGQVSLDDWRWIVDINLWGVIHGCHHFVPRMRAQGSGTIVNVASVAGLFSVPKAGPYSVTKAAVVALSETLHGELADQNIQVTVLCPSFFPTGIVEKGRFASASVQKSAAKLMGSGRGRSAREVALAALTAAERGELFAVPMLDGRALWWAKRASPAAFQYAMVKLRPYFERRRSKRR